MVRTTLISVLFSGFAVAALAEVPSPSRPNVILMLSDDQGWGDVDYPAKLSPGNVYPGHPQLKTPSLRAMAEGGLKFNRMYAASSRCSPTRASFITGRGPRRNDVDNAYDGGMKNLELTVAELAKTQGYMTGHFGKWHLGDLDKAAERGGGDFANCPGADGEWAPRGCQGTTGGQFYSAPWHHGYDRSFVTPQAVPTFEPMRRDPTGPLPSEGNFHGGRYFTGHEESVDIDSPDLAGDDSAIVIRETIRLIDDAVAAKRPFLAVVWFHTPHVPVRLHRKTLDIFYSAAEQAQIDERAKTLYSQLTAMDHEIGRLRAHLRSIGIEGETLLSFTSDNGAGPSQSRGTATPGTPLWDNATGGLRGRKGALWEGGVRVPGLIEWPGHIAPGETDTAMITHDYLPTLMDIWGLEMPDARPLDGESMTEVIFGDRSTRRAGRIEFEHCGDASPERGADEPEDCDSAGRGRGGGLTKVGGGRSIIDDSYKLITNSHGRTWELYDLIEDPREAAAVATSANIASKPQEIQRIFASLREELTTWFEVEAAASRDGADYDTRIASAERVEILGDKDDDTVPDDLSAAGRNTPADRAELVVERQFATLDEDLKVDSDGAAATYDESHPPSGASIAAGTVVHSYLFHYNPTAATKLEGAKVTFDDEILGVSVGLRTLPGSDFLAFANPNFGGAAERRTSVAAGDDSWKILEDRRTIVIDLKGGGVNAGGHEDADQLRIVTKAALQRVDLGDG